ncbi:MAG: hypothetical protein K2M91_06060 [Lachnospiraceae bacterium]|nr:hypothetical protein [Lachnospiraceae bacterium]
MKFKSLAVMGLMLASLAGSGAMAGIGTYNTGSGVETANAIDCHPSEEEVRAFWGELVKFMTYDYCDLLVPVGDKDLYNWSYFITKLREDGISDNGIAGILGNIKANGSVKSYYISGYTDSLYYGSDAVYDVGLLKPDGYTDYEGGMHAGEGHGICSWMDERVGELSDFAISHDYDYITITHWYADDSQEFSKHTCCLPNMECQTEFLLNDLNGEYADVKEKLIEASSPSEAVEAYMQGYVQFYRPWSDPCVSAAESCLPLVQACTGIMERR